METLRIGVIGAGFAGLYATYKLSSRHQITLFEEDSRVGRPKHCTGLVSKWTMDSIGGPAYRSIQEVFDRIVFSAGSEDIVFDRLGIAVKLDRVRLEEELYNESLDKGVQALMGCKVLGIDPEKNIVHTNNCGTDRFDAIIIADGFYGKVSRGLGIDRSRTRSLVGINIEIQPDQSSSTGIEPKTFKVVFHRRFKGFFSWILSLPAGKIIVGGGRIGEPVHRDEVVRSLGISGTVLDAYGGTILTGPPVEKPYLSNVFVTGDAAGLTKPFTGGGLYPNVKLVECFNNNRLSGWRNCIDSIIRELKVQTKIARIFHEDLEDTDLEELFKTLKKTGFAGIISSNIDYDRHEELVQIALSHKKLLLSSGLKYTLKKPVAASKIVYKLLASLFT